jgi:ribosome-associated heat shock protein Hsp15
VAGKRRSRKSGAPPASDAAGDVTDPAAPATEGATGSLRIDKWLWHARFFKTRSLAAEVANGGKIRLGEGETRVRVGKAAQTVKPGDVVTFPKGTGLKIVRVVDLGTRRGPAPEAQALYEDLTPPPSGNDTGPDDGTASPAPAPGERSRGAGRPSKRERRQIDKHFGKG